MDFCIFITEFGFSAAKILINIGNFYDDFLLFYIFPAKIGIGTLFADITGRQAKKGPKFFIGYFGAIL